MTRIVSTAALAGLLFPAFSAYADEPPASATSATPSNDSPAASPISTPAAEDETTDCVIGFAVWCFARTSRAAVLPATKWRFEGNAGYKFSNIYYGHEIRGCAEAGCTLDFTGPSFALGAFYNVKGNPHTDDYIDVGVAVSYMPIISEIVNNTSGFQSEYGYVQPGDGSLAYIPVRLALRRPSFLYVINSKYLVSEFGVGVAFPVATGAGQSFTGANGVKATLGGRLGVEFPVAEVFRAGLAGNWSVIWYGDLLDASFQTSYGLHFAYLL